MTSTTNPQRMEWTLFRLAAICALPLALYAARVVYAGRLIYGFLAWNLFLAWLPLVFAYAAVRVGRRRPWAAAPLLGAWLAFLPNAPYLITDLIWLEGRASTLKVYDAALFFAAATCGLALGFVSLRWAQALVGRWVGTWGSRLFVLAALGLSGFGVYLGRFRRWNSWDIVTDPLALFADIANRLAHPIRHWEMWAMTALFAGLLICLYGLWVMDDRRPVKDDR